MRRDGAQQLQEEWVNPAIAAKEITPDKNRITTTTSIFKAHSHHQNLHSQ